MELVNTTMSLAEEVIDSIFHLVKDTGSVSETMLINSLGKTPSYIKKCLSFLTLIGLIKRESGVITISDKLNTRLQKEHLHPNLIIKKSLTEFKLFAQYCQLLHSGKKEKPVATLIRAQNGIKNSEDQIITIFNNWIRYLEGTFEAKSGVKGASRVSRIPEQNSFFWLDEMGRLVYDEDAHTDKIINNLEQKRYKNPLFIDQNRIEDLRKITKSNFDLRKLIQICEEINDGYRVGNYFTVGVLTRALIDHVPPIFQKKNFAEVTNNYGGKSFRDSMQNLDLFTRKISDTMLHGHVKHKENLPNATTIDCRPAIDFLLGEILIILNT